MLTSTPGLSIACQDKDKSPFDFNELEDLDNLTIDLRTMHLRLRKSKDRSLDKAPEWDDESSEKETEESDKEEGETDSSDSEDTVVKPHNKNKQKLVSGMLVQPDKKIKAQVVCSQFHLSKILFNPPPPLPNHLRL